MFDYFSGILLAGATNMNQGVDVKSATPTTNTESPDEYVMYLNTTTADPTETDVSGNFPDNDTTEESTMESLATEAPTSASLIEITTEFTTAPMAETSSATAIQETSSAATIEETTENPSTENTTSDNEEQTSTTSSTTTTTTTTTTTQSSITSGNLDMTTALDEDDDNTPPSNKHLIIGLVAASAFITVVVIGVLIFKK